MDTKATAAVTKAEGIVTVPSTTTTATEGATATGNIPRSVTPTTSIRKLQQLLQNPHFLQGHSKTYRNRYLNQIRQKIHNLQQGHAKSLTSLNQVRQNVHLKRCHNYRHVPSRHKIQQNVHFQQDHAGLVTFQNQMGANFHLQQYYNSHEALKTGSEMQKISLDNVVLGGGGRFEDGKAYDIKDRYGTAKTMVFQNGEFKEPSKNVVSKRSVQEQNSTDAPNWKSLKTSNVTLEGGGQFLEGYAYCIQDRTGSFKTMVFRNGEFIEPSKNVGSQCSGQQGAACSQNSGISHREKQLHLKSTSVPTATNVECDSDSDIEMFKVAKRRRTLAYDTDSDNDFDDRSRSVSPPRSRSVSRIRSGSPSNRSSSETVKQVLCMGYEEKLVNNVVLQHRTQRGVEPTDLNELLDAVEKERCRQETVTTNTDVSSKIGAAGCSLTSKHGNNGPTSSSTSREDEYQQLKDQKLCKICMELEIEITFAPCGHFITCEQCGKPLKECPICRKAIKYYLKTYMS